MTATILTLRGPELVWTCDVEGNWFQEPRVRIREGNGWREIKAERRLADENLAAHKGQQQ